MTAIEVLGFALVALGVGVGVAACGSDDKDSAGVAGSGGSTAGAAGSTSVGGSAGSNATGGAAGSAVGGTGGSSGNADVPSLFSNPSSVNTVSCQLDDGSSAQCYELQFTSKTTIAGPFCPTTVNDSGGVGIYDGTTNPGFQVMKAALFEAMEADGYDIIDNQGNIRVIDDNSTMPQMGLAYCLALPTRQLQLTFQIPVEPTERGSAYAIDTVEDLGVALDGVPIKGHPPSVVNGPPIPGAMGGNIPSIDPCGGHPDPQGYYHWHFAAPAISSVLEAYGITDIACSEVAQDLSGLVGFAKDGFPIYGPHDDSGAAPTDLDECNGKFGPTSEFPDGIYHYYARESEAPNLPSCIKGRFPQQPFRFQ